ncbi:MAG: MtrB/PioB family outer membrane beta-barrel protein [Burkholderiales bacterium]
MRMKLIATAIASLLASTGAFAADDDFSGFVWQGSATIGGRGTNTDGGTRNGAYATSSATLVPFVGPPDPAKAQEYQDTNSGVIGVIDLRGGNSGYYLRGYGENFGRDDQYINVVGGGYNTFKAQIYSDNIPHNLSFNALTPLQNSGTAFMPNPGTPPYPPARNPAGWNTFNYSTQRDTLGGNVEVSAGSPFYIRGDYNEVTTTGTRPSSGQLGTGSGNGLIEFGIPTEYTTKNTTIDAGYIGKSWNVKLQFLDSKFSNGIQNAQWTNFYLLNGLDNSLLAPDNDLQKWTLTGLWRDLPWDSHINFRVTQSKLTNSISTTGTSLKPVSNVSPPAGVGYLNTTPSSDTFNGDVQTTTATVSWAATPMKGLESRVYYEYYDKQNSSTSISYAAGGLPFPGNTCGSSSPTQFCLGALPAPDNFEYTKNLYGLDLTYRIDARQKILAQYSYTQIDRELEPADRSTIQRAWIEYRNTKFADWSGRLRYQYLQQRSDLDPSVTNNSTANPSQVPYYFTAYDVNNFDQNMVRLNVDWTPLPMTSIGFGATWRGTDFKGNYYGRTQDRTQLYDVTVTYGDPDKFRITAIGNYGDTTFDQGYRNVSTGGDPLPSGPTNSTNFNWGTNNSQENWLVAVLADWVPMDNLRLTTSYSYAKTSGGVDFWSDNYQAAGGFNGGPLVNYVTDNTTTQRFQLKADYLINKQWSLTAGYWFNKYDYTDGQMAGYGSYYPYFQSLGTSTTSFGTNNSWQTGAFANPSYTQNIFYLTVTYRFGS